MASETTTAQREQFADTLTYLSKSPTFSRLYTKLEQSPNLYEVRFTSEDSHRFLENDKGGGTIFFNPNHGLKLATGDVTSAALGFGHEIGHAEHYETDPQNFLESKGKPQAEITEAGEIVISGIRGKKGFEERAVRVENAIAAEVGEQSVRMGPNEGVTVQVPTPTYTCKVARRNPEC